MAVKVMWARAVREEKPAAPRGAAEAPSALASPAKTAVEPRNEKPKRRRSSVYDADGNEVFITLVCLKCHKTRPLSQFGLRKMADGAIRNQPWCKGCRAESAAKSPRRSAGGAAGTGESPATGESLPPTASAPPLAAATSAPPANLAAQIAAALHAGRR
jgi:hypothetical protein